MTQIALTAFSPIVLRTTLLLEAKGQLHRTMPPLYHRKYRWNKVILRNKIEQTIRSFLSFIRIHNWQHVIDILCSGTSNLSPYYYLAILTSYHLISVSREITQSSYTNEMAFLCCNCFGIMYMLYHRQNFSCRSIPTRCNYPCPMNTECGKVMTSSILCLFLYLSNNIT